jgi:hypothetical protein
LADAAGRLAAAPPYALQEAAEAALRAIDPDARCLMYLVDYRIEELRPLDWRAGRDSVRVDGSRIGQCFASQQVLRAGVVDPDDGGSGDDLQGPRAGGDPAGESVIAPISVRGDRLGALVVSGETLIRDADVLDGIARLATAVGHALLVADRVTDVYRVARRGRSLTLSAEIQWSLLPGRSLNAGYASIAGQLEPAYSVVGDAYDWVADATGLSALVVDGAGYGTQASDNAAFTIAAARNARREGADLAGQARLTDQALHARHGGEQFASAVLFELDPRSGMIDVIAAGAGVVLVAGRGGVRRLPTRPQPPLGTEEEYPYRSDAFAVAPGDRIVVASDGLVDAQVSRLSFGERLDRLIHGYRLLGSAELVRAVIRELRSFHDGSPQADDAVILCVDVSDLQV